VAATIVTERLELVPATPASVRAALDGPDALGAALGASVPPTWPPDFLDDAALAYTLERLGEGAEQDGWWLHFVVHADASAGERAVIGSAGYKGPPDAAGVVEIGYAIVRDRRRRGYATEAARALVARAFDAGSARVVAAETLPELAGSIGVLEKCGLRQVEGGSEPGVLRFELTRGERAAPGRSAD